MPNNIATTNYVKEFIKGVESETVSRVNELDNNKQSKTLSTSLIVNGESVTTVEDAINAVNDLASSSKSSGGTPKLATTRCIPVNTSTWSTKTWSGLTSFYGRYIWTDGDNIYYSDGSTHYVLDKSTSTWSTKTWSGYSSFNGLHIWTDGDNIYFSNNGNNYVLNKSTSTWSTKTWSGLTSFNGNCIWTDGDNIYYSNNGNNYVLNKSTSTWTAKTWSGYSSFYGDQIWTDGENIYHSYNGANYVLNKSTSTWTAKTWSGLTSFIGLYIWTDGDNIYYSDSSNQYVLDKSTSTWSTKTWSGLTSFIGRHIWTDGDNIYCSDGSTQYVLDKSSTSTLINGGDIGGKYATSNHSHATFTGADGTNAGAKGMVPAPTASQNTYFLRGDGTWQPVSADTTTPHQTNGVVGAGYYHRNIAYGTSSTPTSDSTYGVSGSMYIYYS